MARAGELAGFILFRRNVGDRTPVQIGEQNALLHSLAPDAVPLWVSLDQEGGRVARLGPPVVKLPPMRVLGDIDDPVLTQDAASLLGRQLGALGFNLDFAPVLDIDTNPGNPVIGDRSFSAQPAGVIRHARAFAAGLAEAGIASCGKHFPGHGDTVTDSHLTLPRLPHDRARLTQVELVPFASLAAELPCIMTAHVLFELFDSALPATLSPAIVTGLLRTELDFRGLIFSDDLHMKAVCETYGVPEAACLAIAAGCDQVLVCQSEADVFSAHEALIKRAESDARFAERLHVAAEHGRHHRSRYPARAHAGDAASLMQQLAETHSTALEERIRTALRP